MITIYTDGACSGNPGIGGWGAVIIKEKKITHLSGGLDETTNNQMELTAAIKALEYFKEPEKIAIHTDSCLLYTSPSPRDRLLSRMPSSA